MKKLALRCGIIMLAMLLCVATLLMAGCSSEEKLSYDCHCDIVLNWTETSVVGKMAYDYHLQRWYIEIGDVFLFPQSLKKEFEEEGLQVFFSGDVYSMAIDSPDEDAYATTYRNYYCINLLSIEKVEDNEMKYVKGEWRLVGWQYENQWYKIDPYIVKPHRFALYILEDETYSIYTQSLINSTTFENVFFKDNQISYKNYSQTNAYSIIEDAQFYDEHIKSIKSYQIDGHQLKLFFSATDYFVFTNQFTDEPKMDDKWYDGPDYPYVATLKSADAEKDEVEVSILVVPDYPTTGTVSSEYLHHPGAQSICHFKFSEWTDKTIEPGDKLFLYITSFQQTDANEPNRTFTCHVKPYEDRSLIENKEGHMYYENHLGWYIKDANDYHKTRYYPMKNLDEKFLQEGHRVYFSGYRYAIPENKGYYFIDLTKLSTTR